MKSRLLTSALAVLHLLFFASPVFSGQYQNFRVSVYITVGSTKSLSDPVRLADDWARLSSQLKIDKVYLENYRDNQWADEPSLDAIKKFFESKGVEVSGGVTMAAGNIGGQFKTFSYADPEQRETVKKAIEMSARHFDEIILDDFFFYCTKTDADIAAKGNRSWTQYRLDAMRDAAKTLVVGPAKAINPKVKVIIKFPNWYEHFQNLGFDLEQEPGIFDGIYTGTETRDAASTDQHLQAYESYEILRYFENIAPGRNGGGWVDTFSTGTVDRYAEQLWDTAFAKPKEITLFNWTPMTRQPPRVGDRSAWEKLPTSFDYNAMLKSFQPPAGAPTEMTWGRVAGYSLEQADAVLGKLGQPIGIKSYRPLQTTGEDFLHHYLGMIGLPIEMTPTFPTDANLVLLTEAAKADPDIVAKIKAQLTAGKNVVITSGLVQALQGKGIEDIVELRCTGRKVAVNTYLNGYGPGNGANLSGASVQNPTVLIPEVRFPTNDAWQLVSAVAADTGYPLLLMDRYSKGILYVLTIPENPGDLYNLPQGVLSAIKRNLLGDFPVWLDSPAKVSLFAYDNHTFIAESFRDEPVDVTVSLASEFTKLKDCVRGASIPAAAPSTAPASQFTARFVAPRRSTFTIRLNPHSYQALAAEP